jgi:hypothetical protein
MIFFLVISPAKQLISPSNEGFNGWIEGERLPETPETMVFSSKYGDFL